MRLDDSVNRLQQLNRDRLEVASQSACPFCLEMTPQVMRAGIPLGVQGVHKDSSYSWIRFLPKTLSPAC
jgi:hypothetical protein